MSEQVTIDIPPQEGRGFWVAKGQTFRIVDPEGQQVADLWAIGTDAGENDWLSTSQTRDITERLFANRIGAVAMGGAAAAIAARN